MYVHDTIIHNENFVVADIHTQSVESLWKRAKAKLRKGNGTSEELMESYVKEAMWRENYAMERLHQVFQVFCGLSQNIMQFLMA